MYRPSVSSAHIFNSKLHLPALLDRELDRLLSHSVAGGALARGIGLGKWRLIFVVSSIDEWFS
jgi:hypothetical protein